MSACFFLFANVFVLRLFYIGFYTYINFGNCIYFMGARNNLIKMNEYAACIRTEKFSENQTKSNQKKYME